MTCGWNGCILPHDPRVHTWPGCDCGWMPPGDMGHDDWHRIWVLGAGDDEEAPPMDSQTDALVKACHERNIHSPVDLAAALRPSHPSECPRCRHPWAHHVCYTHGRGQCQCPDSVSPITASHEDAK